FSFFLTRPLPLPPLFPYTTLFRSQNRPQATVAGPYSLRPKPGAPVSMPLHWEEVKKGLKIRDFTIHNAIARLKSEGDLFTGVLGDRKSTRLNSSHVKISYAVFCLK